MTTESPTTQRDFVELQTDVSHSPLWNRDLAPTTIKERTWSTWNIAALWIGMSVVITTYTLAGAFIEAGMNWWQAMITILRAIVACGWFGIQTWIGGTAIDVLLGYMFPAWKGLSTTILDVALHTWI